MRKFVSSFLVAVLLTLANFFESSGQSIRFVDLTSTGLNDGSSWENAFSSLQDALGSSLSGDELWVAEGIYRPDEGMGITPGDRDTSFVIPNGISLYGGFSGIEDDRNQRDWVNNRTILSGDLLNNDEGALRFENPFRADNSRQLVRIFDPESETRIDGITMSGGHLEDVYFPRRSGSAISYNGGGIGTVYITNVEFNSNVSWIGTVDIDGGFANQDYAIVFRSSKFINNWAEVGSSLSVFSSRILIDECEFRSNVSTAGSMLDTHHSSVFIKDSIFASNINGRWGVILSHGEPYGELSIWKSRFFQNTTLASAGGGAISVDNSHLLSVNNLFSGNHTEGSGGAIYLGTESAQIINNVFAFNSASDRGGAITSLDSQDTDISNSILWKNSAPLGPAIYSGPIDNIRVSNSVAEGQEINDSVTEGEFWNLDPLFVDPDGPDNIPGTEDDDFRLLAGSSLIDLGDNSFLPSDQLDLDGDGDIVEPLPVDLDSNIRTYDGGSGMSRVDIGIYEYDAPPIGTHIENKDALLLPIPVRFDVFPIPSSGHLSFVWRASSGVVKLELFDLLGRRRAPLFEGLLIENTILQFDISAHPVGIYFVRESHSGLSTKVIFTK